MRKVRRSHDHPHRKGRRYRYYACSIEARQGPTACEGMAVPMDKLDDLVADHLEQQLLQPERLETILAAALDRRRNTPSAAVGISPS